MKFGGTKLWSRRVAAGVGLVVMLASCQSEEQNPNQVGGAGAPATVVVATGGTAPTTTSATTVPATIAFNTVAPLSTTPASSTTVPGADSDFGWTQKGNGTDEGSLTVPADYDDPDGEQFSLAVARHRATSPDQRIGTLIVSPDGPGVPGTRLALTARQLFDPQLLAFFDIIAFDARGTGRSSPTIDCIDDYDEFYTRVDRTPGDDDEREELVDAAESFFDGCESRTGSDLANFSTNNTARDVETIRSALGEQTISFLGFGYGSEVGATWASLYPNSVRAAVFDGAPDPRADWETRLTQRYSGLETALQRFFASCFDRGCGFVSDSDPEASYEGLLNDLDDNPVDAGNRPAVNRDVAIGATIEAMESDADWNSLDLSLQAAQDGDGSGLITLYDRHYGRRRDGTYPNELEAQRVISCVDGGGDVDADESDTLARRLSGIAPLLVPSSSVGGYECTGFPGSGDLRKTINGGPTSPVLVIGTTGGSSAPLVSSQSMAGALGTATFLKVDADRHIGYDVNRCVVEMVNSTLLDLQLPSGDASC